MKAISSRHNPIVRAFRALVDAPDPRGTRVLLDGLHLVREAHLARLAFETVAIAESRLDGETAEAVFVQELGLAGVPVLAVSDSALAAMSPVRSPTGLVAIATRTPIEPASVLTIANGFTVVAVDVQDPGNLGALIRASEAGGATGVLVAGASAHPFSWKALRGSMGSILRMPVADAVDPADIPARAKHAGVRTIAAVPRGGQDPDGVNWTGPIALLLGGEGAGLSDALISQCDEQVTLPMAAPVESLNVAVAGAILVYAARRQRT